MKYRLLRRPFCVLTGLWRHRRCRLSRSPDDVKYTGQPSQKQEDRRITMVAHAHMFQSAFCRRRIIRRSKSKAPYYLLLGWRKRWGHWNRYLCKSWPWNQGGLGVGLLWIALGVCPLSWIAFVWYVDICGASFVAMIGHRCRVKELILWHHAIHYWDYRRNRQHQEMISRLVSFWWAETKLRRQYFVDKSQLLLKTLLAIRIHR